jgi:hypothetical protein
MKTSHWFGIGILGAVVSLGLIAHSHSSARHQATQLVAQDAAGQDESQVVDKLRQYASHHMGASVSFVLNGAFERQQQLAQTEAQPQTSGDVYKQAQAACASIKNPVQQAQCNQNYLNSHLQAATPSRVTQPNQADFSYVFASPVWTPDAAGLVLAASVLALLIAAGRLVLKK